MKAYFPLRLFILPAVFMWWSNWGMANDNMAFPIASSPIVGVSLVVGDKLDSGWVDDNSFIFASQENYPPFSYYDEEGIARGIDIDIIKAAAERAGVSVTFRLSPWARSLRMADMKNNNKIGVVRDYSISKDFDESTDINKIATNSVDSLFKMLSANRLSLAVLNKYSGLYTIQRLRLNDVRLLPYVINRYPAYLAFSKRSRNGRSGLKKFSHSLKKMESSGEIQSIQDTYLKQCEGRNC